MPRKKTKEQLDKEAKARGEPAPEPKPNISSRERLELETGRARRAGTEAPVLTDKGRVLTPSSLKGEGEAALQLQKRQEEEKRKLGFQEDTGSSELLAGVEEKILNPPSLETSPGELVTAGLETIGGTIPENKVPSIEELIAGVPGLTQKEKKVFRGSAKVTSMLGALGAAGALIAPAISLAGINLAGWAKTSGAVLIGGGLFGDFSLPGTDINRKDIEVSRGVIQEMSESPTDIIGMMDEGFPVAQAITVFTQMNNDIDFHESRIQNKAIVNAQFAFSEEHFEIEKEILTARQSLAEAIRAAENIAAAGVKGVNPEGLMYHSNNLKDREERVKKLND